MTRVQRLDLREAYKEERRKEAKRIEQETNLTAVLIGLVTMIVYLVVWLR